jgi:hypothetical protein
MSLTRSHTFHAVVRTLVVIVVAMATGYIFYGKLIFVQTAPPSQFTFAGITAGLLYGISKSASYRKALAALLIWYFASILLSAHNSWIPILRFAYIAGVACAVYVYIILIRRPLFRGLPQRVVTMSLLTAIVNALLIPILFGIQALFGYVSSSEVPRAAIENFRLGALIGLGIGVSIEIAEYILRLRSFREFIEGASTG